MVDIAATANDYQRQLRGRVFGRIVCGADDEMCRLWEGTFQGGY
jgi:hypothetical protein